MACHRIVDEGIRRPITLATTDAQSIMGQHLRAFLGVKHLGVELYGIGRLAIDLIGGVLHIVS